MSSPFPINARVAVSTLIATLDPDEPGRERYLVMKHKRGKWEMAGGKLEPGETLVEAAAREVKEETGKSVNLNEIIGVYSNPTGDGNTFIFVVFRAWTHAPFEPEMVEHTEHKWVTREEARELLEEMSPRARATFEMTAPSSLFHRDVTEKYMFPWYPGERDEVGLREGRD